MALFHDARDYQILFLSLFLALGIVTRDWSLRVDMIAVTIVTCLLTQWLINAYWHHRQGATLSPDSEDGPKSKTDAFNLRSPLITALGLSLLLRADHPATMVIASVLAIASKGLFRWHDRHFFNPANFGIIATMLLTQHGWVSPGQWGDNAWYGPLFLGAGGLVLQRVGRWDTSVAFLLSYSLLEVARNSWLGWSGDVVLHRLMNGSLLIFALFMITDPRSIPQARFSRILWAIAIALLTFMLRNYFFVSTAPFWALFVLSPLTLGLDRWFPAPRFAWQPTPASSTPHAHEVGTDYSVPPSLSALPHHQPSVM